MGGREGEREREKITANTQGNCQKETNTDFAKI